MRGDTRYRWLGSVPHAASAALARFQPRHGDQLAHGGRRQRGVRSAAHRRAGAGLAHSGNVGLLGRGYAGYFPVEDESALAGLMARTVADRRFYQGLKKQVGALRSMVAPRAEAAALLAVIASQVLFDEAQQSLHQRLARIVVLGDE